MARSGQQPPRAWSAKTLVKEAISETDNAAFPRPKRYLRLVCPRWLSFDHDAKQLKNLFGFLNEIRAQSVESGKSLLLDLRGCERIDPVGAVLLAAEVEHFNRLRPGRVSGWEPTNRMAQTVLAAMGFYRAIGWEHPDERMRFPGVARIVSGAGIAANIPAQLGEVAELANETWENAPFANRIHGALNEALTNVIMHAYAPDLMSRELPTALQRWWAAGVANPSNHEAWIMVLDHGVGIPTSAPSRHRNLQAFWANAAQRPDHEIIFNLIGDEDRSRTGLSQHGRGLPAMLALVKDHVETGAIWIISGRGVYLFGKLPNGFVLQQHFPMEMPFDGTFVLWKLGKPLSAPKVRDES